MRAVFWFRNDLRVDDNPALKMAIQSQELLPIFILDNQLCNGKNASANRNAFLAESLIDLDQQLQKLGSKLHLYQGDCLAVIKKLITDHQIDALFYTKDYSKYALTRDQKIINYLKSVGVQVMTADSRTLANDLPNIKTGTHQIYKVFTPFYKKVLDIPLRPTSELANLPQLPNNIDSQDFGILDKFIKNSKQSLERVKGGTSEANKHLKHFVSKKLSNYQDNQNDLAKLEISQMSAYLHFGCLSPLQIYHAVSGLVGSEQYIRQLIWRDFYIYIYYYFPETLNKEFQPKYQGLVWHNNLDYFEAWKNGLTGYPIVDAAMRQLRQTGYMHNRARLIVSSFLIKDLHVDWRLGRDYFMQILTDGDTAVNTGNWQWIASTGVDPAPINRRLYNPLLQSQRYDESAHFIKKFLPELSKVPIDYIHQPELMPHHIQQQSGCIIGVDYPTPVVNHSQARQIYINMMNNNYNRTKS